MAETTVNITDSTVTFGGEVAFGQDKVDKNPPGPVAPGAIATYTGAYWGNSVDKLLIQTNEVFNGVRAITAIALQDDQPEVRTFIDFDNGGLRLQTYESDGITPGGVLATYSDGGESVLSWSADFRVQGSATFESMVNVFGTDPIVWGNPTAGRAEAYYDTGGIGGGWQVDVRDLSGTTIRGSLRLDNGGAEPTLQWDSNAEFDGTVTTPAVLLTDGSDIMGSVSWDDSPNAVVLTQHAAGPNDGSMLQLGGFYVSLWASTSEDPDFGHLYLDGVEAILDAGDVTLRSRNSSLLLRSDAVMFVTESADHLSFAYSRPDGFDTTKYHYNGNSLVSTNLRWRETIDTHANNYVWRWHEYNDSGVSQGDAMTLERGGILGTRGNVVIGEANASGRAIERRTATGGAGGSLTVSAGATTFAGSAGGLMTVRGGAASNGNGGGATLQGRDGAGTNRNGGSATVQSGNATGNGTAGGLNLTVGTSPTGTSGSLTANVGGSNRLVIPPSGAVTVDGTPLRDHIATLTPADAQIPSSNPATITTLTDGTCVTYATGAVNNAAFSFRLPSWYPGNGVEVVLRCQQGALGTGDLDLRLICGALTDASQNGTEVTTITAVPNSANLFNVSFAISHANLGSPAAGAYMRLRVRRAGAGGGTSDTFASSLRLFFIGVDAQ